MPVTFYGDSSAPRRQTRFPASRIDEHVVILMHRLIFVGTLVVLTCRKKLVMLSDIITCIRQDDIHSVAYLFGTCSDCCYAKSIDIDIPCHDPVVHMHYTRGKALQLLSVGIYNSSGLTIIMASEEREYDTSHVSLKCRRTGFVPTRYLLVDCLRIAVPMLYCNNSRLYV
jgi:hypothetical protein